MPWHIVGSGKKFRIVSNETGKVMGTHQSRKGATAQLRALYVNVPEARKSADYVLTVPIEKAWSEEARQAAAEARRGREGSKDATLGPTKDAQRLGSRAEVKRVKEAVLSDSVGRAKNGDIVVRQEYFYRHGQTSRGFASAVSEQLTQAGIQHEVTGSWDKFTPFRGGASTARSSHFGVSVKLKSAEVGLLVPLEKVWSDEARIAAAAARHASAKSDVKGALAEGTGAQVVDASMRAIKAEKELNDLKSAVRLSRVSARDAKAKAEAEKVERSLKRAMGKLKREVVGLGADLEDLAGMKSLDVELMVPLDKAWSEEAREAAAAARAKGRSRSDAKKAVHDVYGKPTDVPTFSGRPVRTQAGSYRSPKLRAQLEAAKLRGH